MSFGSDQVNNILDIARIQQKRGDQTALHKTLQLAHDAIRMNLVSPLEREKKNSLRSHRYGAAWSLVQVAVLERDAGDEHSSQSTLDQVMTLLQTRSPDEIASILLLNGFTDEAARQLERFVAAPTAPAFMAIKTTEANGWNPLARLAAHHAKAAGVNNAMRWVLKISDMSLRAKCLTAISTMLSPLPAEEREFILSGDKACGANIGASIRLAGYNASYNFDEVLN